jgi:hypothetical protein
MKGIDMNPKETEIGVWPIFRIRMNDVNMLMKILVP